MYQYCVLITYGENGFIKHAYSPDLKYSFNVIEQQLSTKRIIDVIKSLQQQILDKLKTKTIADEQFQEPKKLRDYNHITIDSNQSWIQIFVNFKPKKGLFAISLPLLGHAANVIALVCGALVSLAAIAITIGKDKESAIPLGIGGAILSVLVIGMLYIFSDATRMLRNMGHVLDKLFSKKLSKLERNVSAEEHESLLAINSEDISRLEGELSHTDLTRQLDSRFEQRGYSTKAILTCLGASSLVLANTVVTGIKTYQETKLLGVKYQEEYPKTPTWCIDTAVWGFLIGANIANLAFQLSFGMRAAEMVEARQFVRIKDPGHIENTCETEELKNNKCCC